jgi:hypothetical protein
MAALQSEFAKLATECGSWGTRADQGSAPQIVGGCKDFQV